MRKCIAAVLVLALLVLLAGCAAPDTAQTTPVSSETMEQELREQINELRQALVQEQIRNAELLEENCVLVEEMGKAQLRCAEQEEKLAALPNAD